MRKEAKQGSEQTDKIFVPKTKKATQSLSSRVNSWACLRLRTSNGFMSCTLISSLFYLHSPQGHVPTFLQCRVRGGQGYLNGQVGQEEAHRPWLSHVSRSWCLCWASNWVGFDWAKQLTEAMGVNECSVGCFEN